MTCGFYWVVFTATIYGRNPYEIIISSLAVKILAVLMAVALYLFTGVKSPSSAALLRVSEQDLVGLPANYSSRVQSAGN